MILRPAATTISTRIASGNHLSIDELSANDGDYIETLSLSSTLSAQYECLLDAPPRVPVAQATGALRWRAREMSDGSFCTMRLVQGTTVLASAAGEALSSIGFQEYEDDLDITGVTDWTDIRIRADFTVLSGSGIVARLSWLRFTLPDPDASMGIMFEQSF